MKNFKLKTTMAVLLVLVLFRFALAGATTMTNIRENLLKNNLYNYKIFWRISHLSHYRF